MESDYTPSSSEKFSVAQSDLRRIVMTESVVFIIIGCTSFLSLIFSSNDHLWYLICSIMYALVQVLGGLIGLVGTHNVNTKFLLLFLILVVVIAILNLLAIGVFMALSIKKLNDGLPHCSHTCDLTRFIYIATVGYFLLETLSSAVLFIFSCIAFKHTLRFYKREMFDIRS